MSPVWNQPSAQASFRRGLVLQVAGEEIALRVRSPRQRTSSSPGVPGGASSPSSSTSRDLDERLGLPKQLVPTRRGSWLAITQAGGAGLGHRPGLDQRKAEARFEGRVVLAVDAGAEAPAHRVIAVGVTRRRRQQHRRHHAQVVHDRGAALAHALPPALRVEAVELHQAAAGDEHHHRRERHRVHVIERQRRDDAFAHRGARAHTPSSAAYHSPARRK